MSMFISGTFMTVMRVLGVNMPIATLLPILIRSPRRLIGTIIRKIAPIAGC